MTSKSILKDLKQATYWPSIKAYEDKQRMKNTTGNLNPTQNWLWARESWVLRTVVWWNACTAYPQQCLGNDSGVCQLVTLPINSTCTCITKHIHKQSLTVAGCLGKTIPKYHRSDWYTCNMFHSFCYTVENLNQHCTSGTVAKNSGNKQCRKAISLPQKQVLSTAYMPTKQLLNLRMASAIRKDVVKQLSSFIHEMPREDHQLFHQFLGASVETRRFLGSPLRETITSVGWPQVKRLSGNRSSSWRSSNNGSLTRSLTL